MVIADALREAIRSDMALFPEPRGALLHALHRVQDEHGAVTRELAGELAELFEMRPIEVLEVVSFYTMLDTAPRGRHRVRVCTNLSCSLRGARDLLRAIERHLRIDCGETTPDGRITLEREECLGACAVAPMLRVGGRYHENLDSESACALLDALE